MHQFQPFSPELAEFKPFTKFDKEWAALTVSAKDTINSMTVSWGGFGTIWNKPTATVYVRESRYTKELLDHSSRFSISFFDEKYRHMLQYLGAASGRDEDKIKNSGLHVINHLGTPYFDEANFSIICRKMAAIPVPEYTFMDPTIKSTFYEDDDYHTIYLGEIMTMLAR